jgi:hypothetical protein
MVSSQGHAKFFWEKEKESIEQVHSKEFILREFSASVDRNLYKYRLSEIRRKLPNEIAQMNQQTIDDLKAIHPDEWVKEGKVMMPMGMIQKLQSDAIKHPVVGKRAVSNYDPTGNWGFCFALSFYIHRKAVNLGLSSEAIKKIWAIGPLRAGGKFWTYHSATILYTEKGWVAIDTLFSEPLTVEEWTTRMSQENPDGTLRFYVSNPEKAWPQDGAYSQQKFGLDPSGPVTGYTYLYRDLFASLGFSASSTAPFDDLLPRPLCSEVLLRK